MKKLVIAMILIMIVLVGCSSGGNNVTKQSEDAIYKNETGELTVNEEAKITDVAKDAEKLAFETALKYFEHPQGTVPKELRKQMKDAINDILLFSSDHQKNKFTEVTDAILLDDYEVGLQLITELGKDYGATVIIDGTPVTVATEEEFSNGNIVNIIQGLDPTVVSSEIESIADEEWEDNDRMKNYTIERLNESYNKLLRLSIDNEAKFIILQNAYDEWGFKFNMVLHEYKGQLDAYNELMSLDADNETISVIIRNALMDWGNNYKMVMYEYEKQSKAFLEIEGITEDPAFNSDKMKLAINKWGDNYAMVLYEYKK